jgi:hypothetical protein
MAGEFVLRGHMRWIVPFFIVLLTVAFINNWWRPMKESFELMEHLENEKKEKKEKKEKETPKQKIEEKKLESEADKLEKGLEANAKASKRIADEMEDEDINTFGAQVNIKETKEGFETFDNTAEVLRKGWRHKKMPSPLEAYYGPIQGYNCGEYSEFKFSSFVPPCLKYNGCGSKWVYPSNCPDDFIFPGKIAYKGEVPLAPYFMQHEADVFNKRYQAEMLDPGRYRKQISAQEADYLDRPNYQYHRGDKTWGPILDKKSQYRPKYSY